MTERESLSGYKGWSYGGSTRARGKARLRASSGRTARSATSAYVCRRRHETHHDLPISPHRVGSPVPACVLMVGPPNSVRSAFQALTEEDPRAQVVLDRRRDLLVRLAEVFVDEMKRAPA